MQPRNPFTEEVESMYMVSPITSATISMKVRDSSTRLDTSDIIGIAVGVTSGVIALFGVVIAYCSWRYPKSPVGRVGNSVTNTVRGGVAHGGHAFGWKARGGHAHGGDARLGGAEEVDALAGEAYGGNGVALRDATGGDAYGGNACSGPNSTV
ncbi:hypothetical protein E8E14_006413 [Neopestalotiopsis sp. 37M]|nr:hypothetical protein E8E14_006413 [Neopestalotiopsis sp. 37M]